MTSSLVGPPDKPSAAPSSIVLEFGERFNTDSVDRVRCLLASMANICLYHHICHFLLVSLFGVCNQHNVNLMHRSNQRERNRK